MYYIPRILNMFKPSGTRREIEKADSIKKKRGNFKIANIIKCIKIRPSACAEERMIFVLNLKILLYRKNVVIQGLTAVMQFNVRVFKMLLQTLLELLRLLSRNILAIVNGYQIIFLFIVHILH